MTGRRSHGRLSALNGVVHQGSGTTVLARLRNQTVFSLAALNAAIRALLDAVHDRPLQRLVVSRRTRYERLDRPALRPLPTARYTLAEWTTCRVNIDDHVEVARHPYSVLFQLIHERGEARYTTMTVELFYKGRPLTAHRRR